MGPSHYSRFLALVALCGFSVVEPVLQKLSSQPAFLVAHGFDSISLYLFVAVIVLLVPTGLWLFQWVSSFFTQQYGRGIHLLCIFILLCSFFMQLFKLLVSPSEATFLATALLCSVIVCSALLTWLYSTKQLCQQFCNLLILLIPISVYNFVRTPAIQNLSHPIVEIDSKAVVPNERMANTPVIFIVFDEFPLNVLLKTDPAPPGATLDRERFPHFAKLADTSNWFWNTTTINGETSVAVPTILTGKLPGTKVVAPGFQEHPNNLFTLLSPTHQLYVFEHGTRLCPFTHCKGAEAPSLKNQLLLSTADVGALYLHLIVPESLGIDLPDIDADWMNFWDLEFSDQISRGPKKAFSKLRVFLRSLSRTKDQTSLHYLHILLPHIGYKYLPSGREYPYDSKFPVGYNREQGIWEPNTEAKVLAYQRLLLQSIAADRVLGRIIHQLQRDSLFDKSLIVVVADHGVSFADGLHRRGHPSSPTYLEDVLSVPLFIKLPFQHDSKNYGRNLETIDVLATVADVLGMEIPWAHNGISAFSSASPRLVKSVKFQAINRRLAKKRHPELPYNVDFDTIEFSVPERLSTNTIRWKENHFSTGGDLDRLYQIGPYPDLIFKASSEIPRGAAERGISVALSPIMKIKDPTSFAIRGLRKNVPAYFMATLTNNATKSERSRLRYLVAVNGTIACITESVEQRLKERLYCMLPERLFRAKGNTLEVFLFDGTQIRPIELHGF